MSALEPEPTLAPRRVAWIERTTGTAVTATVPVGRGASRRIWLVTLSDGRELVVREDSGTGPVAGTPLDLRREAIVYELLDDVDLPVPRLHGISDDGRALLLDRMSGTAEVKDMTAAELESVTVDYMRCLARLHQQTQPAAFDLGPLEPPRGTSATHADLALWRAIHDTRTEGFTTPVATFALDWLAGDLAPDAHAAPVLCHGDAGPLNFLHDGRRVTAMLDWEFAHPGDPLDDLAWVAVRNQVLGSPLDVALAFATWRDATGWPLDAERLEQLRALVLVRMLVSCDAMVRWTEGKETSANRTQVLLRPLLAVLLVDALRRAGCDADDLDSLDAESRSAWTSSPLVGAFGARPVLMDLGVPA